ncbi:hypothetical protein M8J76_011973 [Diaphorina citri]|nr:hypothetical protein M8J76_011973 [Diaphorina citri]
MGILDTLKAFLGVPKNNQTHSPDQPYHTPSTYFKKPDWANEDEDSDDDLVMRSPPQENFMFSVFSNPLEIHRYFEHQMNEMTKQFEKAFSGDHFFNDNSMLDSFFGQTPFLNPGQQFPAILPPSSDENGSLRDKCLKPDARMKPSQEHVGDSDLDNEFKNGQVNLFKSRDPVQVYTPNKPQVFSSQVFTKIVRRPDGSTEEIRTKQIGDQKYTKIIRTDSEGHTNVHEDIVNIDEDKLKDFQSVGEMPMPRLDFKDWFRFRL